ncbi:hypothetical protein [Lentzea waywayandensis]|uniref:hypothetical protein n=1 Tax=Lentzea waywayandensis TaxID=84724 RepID=UPI000B86F52F|nr:hypothetical protein [Lentzea waywayandensis]
MCDAQFLDGYFLMIKVMVAATADAKLPTAPTVAACAPMVDHERLHRAAHFWRLKNIFSFSHLCFLIQHPIKSPCALLLHGFPLVLFGAMHHIGAANSM